MKSYNSRELFKIAKSKGFRLDRVSGSHHIFVNDKTGEVVVIPHPRNNFPSGTLKKILKDLGVDSP